MRELKILKAGRNTHIYGRDKRSRAGEAQPSRAVLKFLQEPYSPELEQATTERYKALRAAYGEFVPQQRVMRSLDPHGVERVAVAQERVVMADPADVYDRYEEHGAAIEPQIAEQIDEFIRRTREQVALWMREPQSGTLVDLAGKSNLVVSQDQHIRYLDTGSFDESRMKNPATRTFLIFGPMAELEMMAGKSADELFADPLYAEMTEFITKRYRSLMELSPAERTAQLQNKLRGFRRVMNS